MQLWDQLTDATRQQLFRLLSDMVSRRLLPPPTAEVTHEQP